MATQPFTATPLPSFPTDPDTQVPSTPPVKTYVWLPALNSPLAPLSDLLKLPENVW